MGCSLSSAATTPNRLRRYEPGFHGLRQSWSPDPSRTGLRAALRLFPAACLLPIGHTRIAPCILSLSFFSSRQITLTKETTGDYENEDNILKVLICKQSGIRGKRFGLEVRVPGTRSV